MINYIRHDEQFFGTIKLITGEEVLGEILVSEDPDTKQDLIFIQNPAKTKIVELDAEDEQQRVAMGFIRWMNFSDEDFYIVAEDKILTVAPLSTEAPIMYQFFVKQELGPAKKKANPMAPDVVSEPSELNYKQGYIGTVEEARKKLEDLFKS